MSDYAQPDFYRFNEDSLRLVHRVASTGQRPSHILDLGCGSGVIGIELANRMLVSNLTLLEAQAEFLPFIEQNVKGQLHSDCHVKIIHSSFGLWAPSRRYDLIVCNPPYFFPGSGRRSTDPRRELARSFILDDWETLLKKIGAALAPEGRAHLVVRKDVDLGRKLSGQLQTRSKIVEEDHLCFLELAGLDED